MSLCVAIGPSSFAAENDEPLRILEEAGCEVVPNPYSRRLTEEEIIEQLKGVDGLIAGLEPLNAKVIASTLQLKAIARVGEFAEMKVGAILLNSARGELIDEDALVAALEASHVSGAWLDPFWEEPFGSSNPV